MDGPGGHEGQAGEGQRQRQTAPGVGARSEEVGGGHQIGAERREVDFAPGAPGQAAAEQRGDLDGEKQVEGHHAPRHRCRLPVAGEGHEHLDRREVDVAVGQEGAEVAEGEEDGEAAERPVDLEQPGPSPS